MKRAPAFQHYPDRLVSHTRHLSWQARGFFGQLLDWMWLHADDYCSIHDDPAAWILAVPGCTMSEAEAMMAEIQNPHMPLLKTRGEHLVCEGLEKIRERQEARSQCARDAAAARWQCADDANASDPNANASKKHANASSTQCTRVGVGVGVGVPSSEGESERETAPGIVAQIPQRVAAVYGTSSARIGYDALQALHDGHQRQAYTAEDIDAVCAFVKAHRAGKLKDAPAIPQSATKAVERFSELLERAQATRLPKPSDLRAKPLPKEDWRDREPDPDEQAEIAAGFAKFKAEAK